MMAGRADPRQPDWKRADESVLWGMQTPDGPLQEEEALGKAYDARLMRRLLAYLRPYRLRVAVAGPG